MTQSTDPDSRWGPLLDLLDFRPRRVRAGSVAVSYKVGPLHLRTHGIAHGGVLAALMDTALGLSASSVAPNGLDVVTAQLNLHYIRPAREGEDLEAIGEVKHSGRKTAVAIGEIHTRSGVLVATGSATFVFVPAPDLHSPEPGR